MDETSIWQDMNMATLEIKRLALLGLAMAMASCAPPTAAIVPQTPVAKQEAVVPEPTVPEPEMPAVPDSEIRIPQTMFNLPKEGDFRATNPLLPKLGPGSGGVIVRPPTDPPSRVKPTEKPAE